MAVPPSRIVPPNFDQIPLNNRFLVPYDDLGAAGGYGRTLYLPDDLIPTLGLTTLIGHPSGARVWGGRNQAGAADVWVVNQGGGGALGSKLGIKSIDFETATPMPNGTVLGGMNAAQGPVLGWRMAVGIPDSEWGTATWDIVGIQINDPTLHKFTQVADFVLVKSASGGVAAAHDVQWLPYTYDLTKQYGSDNLNFVLTLNNANNAVAAGWFYIPA